MSFNNMIPLSEPFKRPVDAWVWGCLLGIITFLVFVPSLSLGFVYWDDPLYLLNNPALAPFSTTWSWDAVAHIFTPVMGTSYNPLPVLTFAVEKYFFANEPLRSPFVFHFDNIVLHVFCTVSVYFLFIRSGVNKGAAFLGALLFGIHPMRVESVSWVTERKDVLYGLFYVLALICYVNYVKSDRKVRWYLLALFLSVLSCFSKIQAVTLPLSMAAIDILLRRKWSDPKVLLLEKAAWWLIALACGIVNIYTLSFGSAIAVADMPAYSLSGKLALGANAYMVYVVKAIWPYKMLPYYAYPSLVPIIGYVLLAMLPVASLALLVWSYRKGLYYVISGWLFFTCNVVLLLQVFSVGAAYEADRFTYIAYIGLFYIIAKVYEWLNNNYVNMRPFINVALVVYLAFLVHLTLDQQLVWKNTATLWSKGTQVNPDDAFNFYQLGFFYIDEALGKDDTTGMGKSTNELAVLAIGQLSVPVTRETMRNDLSPVKRSRIYQGIGAAYNILGAKDSAIYAFSKGIAAQPLNPDGYMNRGMTYYERKQFSLALADHQQAIKLDPTLGVAYVRAAMCETYLGQLREGINDVSAAIRLDPSDPNNFMVRARIYKMLNVLDSSRMDAGQAKRMGMNVPNEMLQ